MLYTVLFVAAVQVQHYKKPSRSWGSCISAKMSFPIGVAGVVSHDIDYEDLLTKFGTNKLEQMGCTPNTPDTLMINRG